MVLAKTHTSTQKKLGCEMCRLNKCLVFVWKGFKTLRGLNLRAYKNWEENQTPPIKKKDYQHSFVLILSKIQPFSSKKLQVAIFLFLFTPGHHFSKHKHQIHCRKLSAEKKMINSGFFPVSCPSCDAIGACVEEKFWCNV